MGKRFRAVFTPFGVMQDHLSRVAESIHSCSVQAANDYTFLQPCSFTGRFRANLSNQLAGRGIILADDAAENLRNIFHDSFIHGNSGVKSEALRIGAVEYVIGITTGGAEVVRDYGVGGRFVKRLAVNGLDGHALDGRGSVVAALLAIKYNCQSQ